MRSRRDPAVWLLAAALVPGLAGCGFFGDEPRPPATTAATATTPTTASSSTGPTVLEPGRAPRTELRLRLTEGSTTTVALTLDLDVDQRSGDRAQSLHNPPVTETVRFTVDRVRGGEADVSFTFVGASIDRTGSGLTDAEVLTLTADLQQIVGIGGTGTLTDRGELRDFAYDLPEDLDEGVTASLTSAEDQLSALAVPLPTVPVGVGARWEAETTTALAGVELHSTTTYEVTAIDGDVITYEAEVDQDARPQALDQDRLPAGTTARLVSSELTGTTTGTLDLTSVVPSSRYRAEGTQVIELRSGGADPQRLSQQVTAVVVLRPAD